MEGNRQYNIRTVVSEVSSFDVVLYNGPGGGGKNKFLDVRLSIFLQNVSGTPYGVQCSEHKSWLNYNYNDNLMP